MNQDTTPIELMVKDTECPIVVGDPVLREYLDLLFVFFGCIVRKMGERNGGKEERVVVLH